MLVPYATDAPVYHRPWGTVGLIALNTALFFAVGGELDGWILEFGNGLHPRQWVTADFMHLNLEHLAGNMIFLWVFGLVIEGKVGWFWFLLAYLGIGALENFLVQLMTLGMEGGGCLGASGILFGLMAIAMVWAPMNEVRVFYWIFYRFGTFSVTIRTLAIIYALLEISSAFLELLLGRPIGSSFLHLLGAALGFPVGVILLKKNLVDCEGWDLFSLRQGRPGAFKLRRPETTKRVEDRAEASLEMKNEVSEARISALGLIQGYLREGDAAMALAVYQEEVRDHGPWPLDEGNCRGLIQGLRMAGLLAGAKPLILEYVQRFPAKSAGMKLLLVKIYLEMEKRPRKALQILETVPAPLPEALEPARRALIRKAKGAAKANPLEPDLED